MSDKIDYEKAAIYYSQKYKKTAERNRQLIDDIEKADSDYFKMKENRDGWKDSFYKSVELFNKLSDICDKLITARDTLTEENHKLKSALESTEKELYDYQETCDTLTKENERVKKLCRLCGSY